MSIMRSGAPARRPAHLPTPRATRRVVSTAVAAALSVTMLGTPAGSAAGPPHHHQRPPHRLLVHWGDRTPVQGDRSVVTGRVPDAGPRSDRRWSVALQVRHGNWRPFRETTSATNGSFRFAFRLEQFNQAVKLRVVVGPVGRSVAEAEALGHARHSGTAVFRAVWRPRPPRPATYPGVAVVWPAEQVLLGSGQTISGRVTDPGLARIGSLDGGSVSLQRLVVGRWIEVSSGTLHGSAFKLPLPTDFLGHFTYRIAAAGRGPGEIGLTEPQGVAVVPRYSPRGRAESHALISPAVVGRWNPCVPITYRLNVDKARDGVVADVRTALARLAQATGLRFEYLGTTDVVPFATDVPFDPQVADLVIAWVDPDDAPGLFGPGVYGLGGPEMTSGAYDAAGRPVREIWQGGVVFTTTYNGYLDPGAGEGPTRVGALMHELGHAVGLAHVDPASEARAQIMYPSLGAGVDRWGAGDLAGLEELGAANGCVSLGSSPAPLPAPAPGGITAATPGVPDLGRTAVRTSEVAPLP